jgi:hypothetical protein
MCGVLYVSGYVSVNRWSYFWKCHLFLKVPHRSQSPSTKVNKKLENKVQTNSNHRSDL